MSPNKHARKKRKSLGIIIPFLIIALVFGILIWKKYRASLVPPQPAHVQEKVATQTVILFFVADGNRLEREAREIEPCRETDECLRDIMDELFSGPVGDLTDALPEGSLLNSVLVEGDSVTVDVNSNFVSEMPSGSSAEMMAVYAIVNTACANYPQIKRVSITVDGEQKPFLKHLDISGPLAPDFSLEQKPAGKIVKNPNSK